MLKKLVSGAAAVVMATTFSALIGVATSSASGVPSGQRMIGSTSFSTATGMFTGGGASIEPAINDANGSLVYLLTPTKAKVAPKAPVAPIYLPVYPVGSGIDPASLNCAHIPADNCPDHGPGIAGAPPIVNNPVYANGVLGHDHLIGVASTGGDFNFVWEPTLVVFNNAQAARHHITTLAQIKAAQLAGDITVIPLPQLDFNCSIVGAAVYNNATPAPTVG